MRRTAKDDIGKRLRRIEGQVRGVAGMVDEERYCIDVLSQISAVRAALAKVATLMLEEHVQTCVQHAFDAGSPRERREKLGELLEVFARHGSA